MTEPSSETRPRYTLFALATVLVGIVLRLRQYADARPLWLDEAMLSLNVLTRDYRGLLAPLEQDQTAPVPFLWLERFAVAVGGPHELALRAAPLIAGLLFLWCIWRLAERVLAPGPAMLAVAMAALSPVLLTYANEVKPYSWDALVSGVLLLLAVPVLDSPASTRAWQALTLAGAFAAVASSPALFTLGGIGLTLLATPEIRADRNGWRRLVLVGVVWSTLFALTYFGVYGTVANDPYMLRFWAPNFLSPGPDLARRAAYAIGSTLEAFFMAEGGAWRDTAALLLLIPLIAGALELRRGRSKSRFLLFVLPLALVVLASVLRRYPIAPRLMLFTAAPLILLVASGVDVLSRVMARVVRGPWLLCAGIAVLIMPALDAGRRLVEPPRKEDLAPLIREFRAKHKPQGAVYVFGRSVPAWLFYTTDWSAPDTSRVRALGDLVSSSGRAFRHAPTRGHAVSNEGNDLVFPYGDWKELVGVPTGQGPNAEGINATTPDQGWAENEARRLRTANAADTWFVLSSFAAGVPEEFRAALERAGGRISLWEEREGAVLGRVSFD
jgi:dolichyl-phosphate-mannose-protein mannosyltransferase